MAYIGPDISAWQGDIDIKKLSSQVDFFIFRCYAGSTKDKKVDRNVKLAIENNKPYGLYIYSYALNTAQAKEEAERVVKLANSYSVKPTFLCIDMEDADGYKKKYGMPSNQTLRDICTEEGEIFENAGYYAMVYASASWWKNQLNGLTRFDKWIARWPTSGGKQKGMSTSSTGESANSCGIWQFTSQGKLNGYSGNLDMNYCYKDKIISKSNTSSKKPETTKKDKILEDGKWGTETTKKAQKVFGTTVDGIVSDQYKMYKSQNPGLFAFEWKQKPAGHGSQLIKAIQKKVGAKVNGFIGPETITKMQKWLGTTQDGYVSNPSNMVKAFQKWLNKQ